MRNLRTLAIAALMLLAVTAGSASAGALITGAKIKDGTVTGADVRNRSLTGQDVLNGTLLVSHFRGLQEGPKGETGPQGPQGTNGVPGLVQRSAPRTLVAGQRLTWTSFCDLEETAIGGGVSSTRPDLVHTERSFPDGFHWTVQVHNSGNTDVRVFGWALCVPV